MHEHHNRRGHFRLEYPTGAGPALVCADRAFEVLQLSERGLQFAAGDRTPTTGARVDGSLRFADGAEVPIEGVVLRLAGGRVVARLVRGVGLARMLAEQRRIRRAYPDARDARDEEQV